MSKQTTTSSYDDTSILSPSDDLAGYLADLLRHSNKPLRLDSILRMVHVPRKQKKEIEATLYTLQEQGEVVRAKGAWVSASLLSTIEGILHTLRQGAGSVTPVTGGAPVTILPEHMGNALHGDTVQVLVFPGKYKTEKTGKVTKIIQRSQVQIPVIAERQTQKHMWLCAPVQQHMQGYFLVSLTDSTIQVSAGDILLVMPKDSSGERLWHATLMKNLQTEINPHTQEYLGKITHGIPLDFPSQVLAATKSLPANPKETEWEGRKDLRHRHFVTIDGETAKDFDDAICVEEISHAAGAQYRLLVAIADVAHYVQPDSLIDKEAQLRGNSYYFPLSVAPMLPECLSNGLCSLRPHVPRLVMVAEIVFSATGAALSSAFYEAVISSQARLTYTQVFQGILCKQPDAAKEIAPHAPMLQTACALARLLQQQRTQRGNLDFALPEPLVVFDDHDNVQEITAAPRNFAHQLIEECMIAANEAVARYLEEKHTPLLFRVHPAPDQHKLTALLAVLQQHGSFPSVATFLQKAKRSKAPLAPSSIELQRIMQETAQSPDAAALHRIILRAMMQARYLPENLGHYGLASSSYCHFTSPIRRYADLTVHRALKATLNLAGGSILPTQELLTIAEHINATERTAIEAEREVFKRMGILYMQKHIGEVFQGTVSGVTDFGLFVELDNLFIEGMAPLASLQDDYYELLQERQQLRGRHTGTIIEIGQKILVKVMEASLHHISITLAVHMTDGQKHTSRTKSKKNVRPSTSRARQSHPSKKGAKASRTRSSIKR